MTTLQGKAAAAAAELIVIHRMARDGGTVNAVDFFTFINFYAPLVSLYRDVK